MNGKSNDASSGEQICTLTADRLTKIAITICGDGTAKAYCTDESGKMNLACELQLVMPAEYVNKQALRDANLADGNDGNDEDLARFESFSTWLTSSTLYSNWQLGVNVGNDKEVEALNSSVMINGAEIPVKSLMTPALAFL